jgi:hypothetical protein
MFVFFSTFSIFVKFFSLLLRKTFFLRYLYVATAFHKMSCNVMIKVLQYLAERKNWKGMQTEGKTKCALVSAGEPTTSPAYGALALLHRGDRRDRQL